MEAVLLWIGVALCASSLLLQLYTLFFRGERTAQRQPRREIPHLFDGLDSSSSDSEDDMPPPLPRRHRAAPVPPPRPLPPPPQQPQRRELTMREQESIGRAVISRIRNLDLIMPLYDHAPDAICVVCHCDLRDEQILTLPCGHQFHDGCYMRFRRHAIDHGQESPMNVRCLNCRRYFSISDRATERARQREERRR